MLQQIYNQSTPDSAFRKSRKVDLGTTQEDWNAVLRILEQPLVQGDQDRTSLVRFHAQ